MSTKGEIRYGDVEVSDDELSPASVRRRISIMIPEDVLSRLKQIASDEGIGYQTLMNRLLRDAVIGNSITARLERLERAVLPPSAPRARLPRTSMPPRDRQPMAPLLPAEGEYYAARSPSRVVPASVPVAPDVPAPVAPADVRDDDSVVDDNDIDIDHQRPHRR